METKKKVGGKKASVDKIEVLPEIGKIFVLCGMWKRKEKQKREKEKKERKKRKRKSKAKTENTSRKEKYKNEKDH